MLRRIANLWKKQPGWLLKLIAAYSLATTDVFVMSFPRSGRTWLRAIFAYSFNPDTKDIYRENKSCGKKFSFLHEDLHSE